jgi:hypothetical protein
MVAVADTAAARAALVSFRGGCRQCLGRWGDALFELCDAAAAHPGPVVSAPALSLEESSTRSHGSYYRALREGAVGAGPARALLGAHRPAGWPLAFAVDATCWPRPEADTSPDRTWCYSPQASADGAPVVPGWCFQAVVQVGWEPSSWVWPADVRRIGAGDDPLEVAAAQARGALAGLGDAAGVPVSAFDAGYDPAGLAWLLAGERCVAAVRIRDDRVFYREPAPAPGRRGRPRRHGAPFRLEDPSTWGEPEAAAVFEDPACGRVEAACWAGLHPKLARRGRWAGLGEAPIVGGRVARISAERVGKGAKRGQDLWLFVSAPAGEPPDPALWARAYLRRFDIEHFIRFCKQQLGWTRPAVMTPGQADRWTWTVLAAYAQLFLARPLAADLRLPWERPLPPGKLTPSRVRRDFGRLARIAGTPAKPPKTRRPGPGRPKGTVKPPRPRYPVLKRAKTKA